MAVRTWRSIFLIIGLSMFLLACGASGGNAASFDMAESEAAVAPMPAATMIARQGEAGNDGGFADSDTDQALDLAQQPRLIIYTGEISLIVADTDETITAITAFTNEIGGYVANTNLRQSNNLPRGSVTIRVPAEQYERTMAQLRSLALEVEREQTNSQDVTEEFTDLEARKANLEAAETALQQLLTRTDNTEDILIVYRELTDVRGQIEQIQGRLNFLSRSAALSTITVNITPDELLQPIEVAGWRPQGVARDAIQSLINSVQTFIELLIWLAIFFLPAALLYLSPFIVLILLLRWWWLRRRANRPQVSKAKTPAPEDAPEEKTPEA